MRALAELGSIFAGATAVGTFVLTHIRRRQRRESSIEHVKRLERENDELDQALNRIQKGTPQ